VSRPNDAWLDLYGEASQSQAQMDYVVYPTQRTAERRGTRGAGAPSVLIRILIADDHGSVRRLLRALLETRAEWKVCGEAENGREAVSKAAKLRPDLIILDLAMPIMNGLKAAREISTATPAVPILMYTNHSSSEIEIEAKKAGVRQIVSKGGSNDELFRAVVTALLN
jgi:DNA-binding NarL/FixJ family response regulator